MSALAGFKAKVYITSPTSTAFTNEAFTDSGDHKTFTITNSAKRYWDVKTGLTIQTSPDGSTWSTVTSGYTVNYCGGQVTFTTAVSGATPSVRVSGAYFAYSLFGEANSVDISTTTDILDVTTFAGNGWKQKIASLADATIKLGSWWTDNYFLNVLTNQTRMVVSTTTGANSTQRFDAFCYLKGDSIKIAVNNAISEDLDFEADGGLVAVS